MIDVMNIIRQPPTGAILQLLANRIPWQIRQFGGSPNYQRSVRARYNAIFEDGFGLGQGFRDSET